VKNEEVRPPAAASPPRAAAAAPPRDWLSASLSPEPKRVSDATPPQPSNQTPMQPTCIVSSKSIQAEG